MTIPLAVPAPPTTCPHTPPCPPAGAPDHDAAHVVFRDEMAGWSLLCNGVICFCDTGELVGATPVAPHRPEPPHHKET